MSVIGRLDPQVEDVLISPRNIRRPAAGNVPPAAERPEPERPAAGREGGDEADEPPPGRGPELPVWLL